MALAYEKEMSVDNEHFPLLFELKLGLDCEAAERKVRKRLSKCTEKVTLRIITKYVAFWEDTTGILQ